MKIAISKHKDPYNNLSTEEIILKDENIKDDILLFYINKNAIIVGRNQNVHEEINADFVKEKNIDLIRRISGGGTVYHDEGNINFSFITNKSKRSYEKFLEPIINFLKTLGLDAKFKGKNDLIVNNYKVSGNAQYIYKNRMFHHGTILFDTNLKILSKALKVNKLKIESKGIKSIRQRVSNIKPLLNKKINSKKFLEKIINYFINKDNNEIMDLTNYKNNEIKALANIRKSYD
jgi:lipoate-protein ligase A